jgi:prolactin regulatory element-binding protein
MTQGDVLLVNSTNLRVQTLVRKAHLGIVTALAFSHDSRLDDNIVSTYTL